MDKGSVEYQLEAAISKVFASVSSNLILLLIKGLLNQSS